MYKTAIEYYQKPLRKPINYSRYNGPVGSLPLEQLESLEPVETFEQFAHESVENATTKRSHMKWQTKNYSNMSHPSVWGPAFWFTLHNGASKYPIDASPLTKERMKGFILGIPTMLPCAACKGHANDHIENNKYKLDDICSSREKLFKFFVDFHNIVNNKYGKPIVSVEDAYKIHSGGVEVSTLTY
jgi:hypothetical protein